MQQQPTEQERNFALEYDDSWSRYNFIVNLFQLGRDTAHRTKALQLAGLKRGDTVLDICCGSGLSMNAIQKVIGPEGKIIGIDANHKMLQLAEQRIAKNKWKNVQLVECDIEKLTIDPNADIALFALCWYDKELGRRWITKIGRLLKPGTGKFCFIDYKYPDNWLKNIATPILSILVRWLGEAYSVDELRWDPMEEIGAFLKKPRYTALYMDSLFTLSGGVSDKLI